MERMFVAVFDGEAGADAAARALDALEEDGMIAVHTSRIVKKERDGEITVRNVKDAMPDATMGGTAVGSLIGIFGGPIGLVLGATTGAALGVGADLMRARVGRDFVADVTNALTPGKAAVVAEIDEETTAPVDDRMAALGGSVFRCGRLDAENADYDRQMTAIDEGFTRAEADRAARHAERKRRLEARLDALSKKLHRP